MLSERQTTTNSPSSGGFAAFRKWTPRKHRKWCHPTLRTGPSTLQGAGTGVFATQPLKAGTHLGYYCGRVYWRYPKTNARDWAYMLRLNRRPPWIPSDVWNAKRMLHSLQAVCVDGRGTLSLINCCRGKFETDAKTVTKTRELEPTKTDCTEETESRGARCKDTNPLQEKEATNNTGLCAQSVPLENCMFVSTGRCETTRDIDAGQELFVDYGVEYWQDR